MFIPNVNPVRLICLLLCLAAFTQSSTLPEEFCQADSCASTSKSLAWTLIKHDNLEESSSLGQGSTCTEIGESVIKEVRTFLLTSTIRIVITSESMRDGQWDPPEHVHVTWTESAPDRVSVLLNIHLARGEKGVATISGPHAGSTGEYKWGSYVFRQLELTQVGELFLHRHDLGPLANTLRHHFTEQTLSFECYQITTHTLLSLLSSPVAVPAFVLESTCLTAPNLGVDLVSLQLFPISSGCLSVLRDPEGKNESEMDGKRREEKVGFARFVGRLGYEEVEWVAKSCREGMFTASLARKWGMGSTAKFMELVGEVERRARAVG